MIIVFILCFSGFGLGVFWGIVFQWKRTSKTIIRWKGLADKHLLLYEMSVKWIELKQHKKSIGNYLKDKGCYRIGIYGMNHLGRRLFFELKDSELYIVYGIDQNAKDIHIKGLEVVPPEKMTKDIDTVIVTPVMEYEMIQKELLKKLKNDAAIISLASILCDLQI